MPPCHIVTESLAASCQRHEKLYFARASDMQSSRARRRWEGPCSKKALLHRCPGERPNFRWQFGRSVGWAWSSRPASCVSYVGQSGASVLRSFVVDQAICVWHHVWHDLQMLAWLCWRAWEARWLAILLLLKTCWSFLQRRNQEFALSMSHVVLGIASGRLTREICGKGPTHHVLVALTRISVTGAFFMWTLLARCPNCHVAAGLFVQRAYQSSKGEFKMRGAGQFLSEVHVGAQVVGYAVVTRGL